ncbi:MAG: LPS export ABC transporter periplasmic protein LptC [Fidelibacterota bacterium]
MARLAVATIILLLTACTHQEGNGTVLTRENLPDQESWNPTIVLTKEGRKRAVVRSGHLAKYNNRQEVILDQWVDADFYSAEEVHMSNLKSVRALVYEATDNLLAMGDVVVVSDSGVTLFTDSLLWDNEAGRVTSRDTVLLTTESNDSLHGVGFESNVDLTHWKIFRPWGVTER